MTQPTFIIVIHDHAALRSSEAVFGHVGELIADHILKTQNPPPETLDVEVSGPTNQPMLTFQIVGLDALDAVEYSTDN